MSEPTLKTRPTYEATKLLDFTKAEICQVVQEYEEWFEGFEKKLREFDLFTWLNENHPDGEKWHIHGAKIMDTLSTFIEKEILGEDA